MAKIKVVNYTFNAVAKTITFSSYASILLDSIYAVVNCTTNQIAYNPTVVGFGGTVATNVLTLAASTAGMNNTDKLLILYDDPLGENIGGVRNVEYIANTTNGVNYTASDRIVLTHILDALGSIRASVWFNSTQKFEIASVNTSHMDPI